MDEGSIELIPLHPEVVNRHGIGIEAEGSIISMTALQLLNIVKEVGHAYIKLCCRRALTMQDIVIARLGKQIIGIYAIQDLQDEGVILIHIAFSKANISNHLSTEDLGPDRGAELK